MGISERLRAFIFKKGNVEIKKVKYVIYRKRRTSYNDVTMMQMLNIPRGIPEEK